MLYERPAGQSEEMETHAETHLQVDGDEDLVLSPNATHLWVEVRNIAIYIRQGDGGVAVDLYPNHREDEDPLASTWALYADAEETEDATESPAPEEPRAA